MTSDFFKCDCVRTWVQMTHWCNRTAHDEVMDEDEHDSCDGHDRGEPVHCTDYSVDHGDIIQCTICKTTWTHDDGKDWR